MKICNASICGLDVIDRKTVAYRLDCKSKFRFFLRMFFDLIDIAIVNSHIVYTKPGNLISFLDFKIVVGKSFIGRYTNWRRSSPFSKTSKEKALEAWLPKEMSTHMPEFKEKLMRCNFCKNAGSCSFQRVKKMGKRSCGFCVAV